jgi:hypothetical protein
MPVIYSLLMHSGSQREAEYTELEKGLREALRRN